MSEVNHVIQKDGEVMLDKVDEVIHRIGDEKKDGILSDFDEFIRYLSKRIDLGLQIGLNEEQLAAIAEKVAGYLSSREEPRNSEEKLLQELWQAGTKEERHALAHMLVRMAQSGQTT